MPVAFANLSTLTTPVPIQGLPTPHLADLQRGLAYLGLYLRGIDGQFGSGTRDGWAAFRKLFSPGDALTIAKDSAAALTQKVNDLPSNQSFNPANDQDAIDGIKRECRAQGLILDTQIAYVLATAQWETNHSFKPVEEAYYLPDGGKAYRATLWYSPYYGRGYVQLTHKENYKKYGDILGLDLVHNSDLALDPAVALFVLVQGFKTGAFTGARLDRYVNADRADFVGARACINGNDKAAEIAALAQAFVPTI